jgi:uncharacterized protein
LSIGNRLGLVVLLGALPVKSLFAAETQEQAAVRAWQTMTVATVCVGRPDGSTQPLQARVADDPAKRAQGMQFLPPSAVHVHPLWFVFPEPMVAGWHMANVRMPLDIAWVDADGWVVEVQRMEPGRAGYGARVPIRYALELAAGEAGRLGIRPGARLSLTAACPALAAANPSPAAGGGANTLPGR